VCSFRFMFLFVNNIFSFIQKLLLKKKKKKINVEFLFCSSPIPGAVRKVYMFLLSNGFNEVMNV
jgi:hypothetical protein